MRLLNNITNTRAYVFVVWNFTMSGSSVWCSCVKGSYICHTLVVCVCVCVCVCDRTRDEYNMCYVCAMTHDCHKCDVSWCVMWSNVVVIVVVFGGMFNKIWHAKCMNKCPFSNKLHTCTQCMFKHVTVTHHSTIYTTWLIRHTCNIRSVPVAYQP